MTTHVCVGIYRRRCQRWGYAFSFVIHPPPFMHSTRLLFVTSVFLYVCLKTLSHLYTLTPPAPAFEA